ncbi:appetite-regulating hormone-like [Kogia breviceps]|uniref:appetite-regulating hormone-like n=1 Tax=Kogia breviceps TaxID=27615 RepID=UPI0034D20EE8
MVVISLTALQAYCVQTLIKHRWMEKVIRQRHPDADSWKLDRIIRMVKTKGFECGADSFCYSNSPAEATPSPGTICSRPLVTVLWVDLTSAGSSFLSPKPQNVQQRQEPAERAWTQKHKKASAKLKARALEGWVSLEVRSQVEGTENELEMRFNALFDVGIKLSGAQFHQRGQTLGKFLQEVLWEEASEASG